MKGYLTPYKGEEIYLWRPRMMRQQSTFYLQAVNNIFINSILELEWILWVLNNLMYFFFIHCNVFSLIISIIIIHLKN